MLAPGRFRDADVCLRRTLLPRRPANGRSRTMITATPTNGLSLALAAPQNGQTATTAAAPISGPPVPAPRRRRLRTYAFDPMSTRLSGRYLTISVPYETDLARGPEGRLLRVVDYDPVRGNWYALVDLNDAFI